MNTTFLREHWIPIAAGILGLLLLLGLMGTCQPAPDVNTELARATRVAVESAEKARESNDAAYLWPGRLRMLAVALGVAVPIVAAVVLFWIATRRRPCDVELSEHLERTIRMAGTESPRLPAPPEAQPHAQANAEENHSALPLPLRTEGEAPSGDDEREDR